VHRSRPMALIGALLILMLTLAACSGGGGGASATAEGGGETVSLAGGAFSPASLTIPAGTTVTFTNTSGHTVTEGQDGQAADAPIIDEQGGSDITFTFDEPGTYNLTCRIHSAMNMTITVEG
jgi:plastocyanin